jgi:glycosyltransferase involved in cell wall biosynthesis
MSQFYLLGGAERLQVELASELNKRGTQTDMLSLYRDDLPGVADGEAYLRQNNVNNIDYLGLPVNPSLKDIIRGAIKLRSIIKREGYDVIETSAFSPSLTAIFATILTGTKLYFGIHQAYKRTTHDAIKYKLWRMLFKLKKSTRFYAVSGFVKDSWAMYIPGTRDMTRVVYNSINNTQVESKPRMKVRTEFGIDDDTKIVLYVGRIAKYKGVDFLVDTLMPLLEENNLCLLLVGHEDLSVPGTEQMLASIASQLAENTMTQRVRFLGRRSDVHQLMQASDMLVHPTKAEGFGLSLVEALYNRLPIIATRVEAIPEILSATDAILIDHDDASAWQNAVAQILSWDEAKKSDVVEKGFQRSLFFQQEKRTNDMLEYFSL